MPIFSYFNVAIPYGKLNNNCKKWKAVGKKKENQIQRKTDMKKKRQTQRNTDTEKYRHKITYFAN